MVIKFTRGVSHLGYAYRKGGVAASLPEAACKELIKLGVAEEIKVEKPKRKAPQVRTTNVKKKEIETTKVEK